MTRRAWTGSRKPSVFGFTQSEIIRIVADVIMTVQPTDEVATGGCSGVDEIVLETALLLRSKGLFIRIVTFPADGERNWPETRADMELICQSDEIRWRDPGWGYLERDRALVDWADEVRAIPLFDFYRTQKGAIHVPRGSGTAYTAAYAETLGKLVATIPLRKKA